MTTYTLHLPAGASPGDPRPLEEAVLVRDGFSWGAFLFTALWFFRHRLWLAGLCVLAAVITLVAVLAMLGIGGAAAFWSYGLLCFLIGLEAGSLRRWTYARHGRPVIDVVMAASAEEAEAKAFRRWLARDDDPAGPPPGPAARGPASPAPAPIQRTLEPVVGLFPQPERAR